VDIAPGRAAEQAAGQCDAGDGLRLQLRVAAQPGRARAAKARAPLRRERRGQLPGEP
jgi:hypothetical protein